MKKKCNLKIMEIPTVHLQDDLFWTVHLEALFLVWNFKTLKSKKRGKRKQSREGYGNGGGWRGEGDLEGRSWIRAKPCLWFLDPRPLSLPLRFAR